MSEQNRTTLEEHAKGFLGAAIVDESYVIGAISDGVVNLGGHSRESVVGLTVIDVLHPSTALTQHRDERVR